MTYDIQQYIGIVDIPNKIPKDIKQKLNVLHGEMNKSTILIEILA